MNLEKLSAMVNTVTELRKILYQNFINLPGWRTDRKILVIESDDWGSIRMPSKEVYSKFVSRGFDLSKSDYNRIDTLESNEDLTHLYETLHKHKDSVGNPPVITADFVLGNPDFVKIRQSDFTEYHFEPVTETLKKYAHRDKVEALWKIGNSENIFHPQFHGREHVNVVRWMETLKKKSADILFTFDNETTFSGEGDYNFMEVLDYNTPDDLEKMKESLVDGLDLFEKLFGFRSKSFIPPCYTWNSDIEETLSENGVRYIQGLVIQLVPTGSFGNYRKKYHFQGNRNSFGQYYLVRNCFFEPALSKSSDQIGECLKRINLAYRWNKPAIISSHRINYMGSLVEKNRTDNLQMLDELLFRILRNWPHVEFMSSDQLGDLMAESHGE
jgi:hypothetical protein